MKHPRATAAAISGGIALVMLAVMPSVPFLAKTDLALFQGLSGSPWEVLGKGTRADPRRMEVFGGVDVDGVPGMASLEVLFLDDEPSGYFEQVPPPPTDVMVVLDRLRERRVKTVALGYPLQWEEPDTLAVDAMRRVMDRSEGMVLGFPLKDSTAPAPVAAPFQRASVAYADVEGDGTKLPVVSNIRGLAPEMGGKKSLGGFTRLETEEADEERAYLLARWSDRVVFALPVALEVARLGLAFEDVTIHMGSYLRLGDDGPRIPIDFRGRVVLPEGSAPRVALPATAVIAESLPEAFAVGSGPLYLTDERLLGAKAERQWAEALPRVDAAVRGAPKRVKTIQVTRPHWLIEMLMLGLLVFGMAKSLRSSVLKRQAMVLLAWLMGLVLLLTLLIRLLDFGPMPLAFLSVPLTAMAVMAWAHFGGKVEVVDSEEIQKAAVPAEVGGPKRGKKRRKKGR